MATSTRSGTDTLPDTPAGVLSALRAEQDARESSEVRSMRLAAHWVALHPVLDDSCPDACFQSPKTLAGVGSPVIDEFTIPDIATMLGQTCDAVGSYLTDVIELRYCLPQLWAGILAGVVTPWRARRIAQTTVGLSVEAATFVDEQTAWCANRLTPDRAGPAGRPRPRPVHARPTRQRDRGRGGSAARHLRHRPGSPSTAPCTSRPTSTSPTPSASPKPSPPVPPTNCDWARPTPSTAAGPPPSATSPATSSHSASTNPAAG
ncbi:hypothetical protein [Nocardioides sp. B-3]|uniref:hypothetical protein n=1 Tax=Nocardioides sp. B-3 TaxID=2895565 RepID=UPI0021522B72|nr:hypothetical protein [Nocardioides sp. B-3]UUZ58117.1 hypothetical protein LP418_17755 [Nocardioides sp. B-3]